MSPKGRHVTVLVGTLNDARKVLSAHKLQGTSELIIVPMAFESQGGLHANWRNTYVQWATFWGSKDKVDRPAWRQGLMVRAWTARTSLIIQQEHFRIVNYLLTCTNHFKSGAVPNAPRIAASYDFDFRIISV